MTVNVLKVLLWSREVGRLYWDSRKGIGYFEYNPDFIHGNLDPFPLAAPIAQTRAHSVIAGERSDKFYSHLPSFIADSLPDSWGDQVFEFWRSHNGIRSSEISPLDKLSFIGKRAMGALEFIPETSNIKHSEAVNLQELVELSQRLFSERSNAIILPEEPITAQALIAVGTSAGGRQPKAILSVNPVTGKIRSGQIAGREGFEYYILKFGDAERSSAELEMAYYEMAVTAGIEMAQCSLLGIDGKKHFLTRRFDRVNGEKIHMQTLAAMDPDASSYEDLLRVCRKLHLPEPAQTEIFRRLVFNILANNTDDHNKNFSFLMDRSGKWSLAPAYDMTYIFNAAGFRSETDHCLFAQGKLSGFSKEDILEFAKSNGIPRAESVIREVVEAVSRFRDFAAKYGVHEQWINAVESTITSHLNSWGYGSRPMSNIRIGDTIFENTRIERAHKGNFHLYASVEGKEKKFIIGKNREEYKMIEDVGISNLTEAQMEAMVKKFLAS